MKKIITVTLPIFIMIAMAVLCIGIYMVFTNKLPKPKTTQKEINNGQVTINENDNSIILSEEELPSLGASVLASPLMNAVIKDFTQDDNFSDSNINFSDTKEGYKKLIDGQIDILFALEPTDDIITIAEAKGVELELIPIAKEAFVFYVNSANPVDALDISDIQKIYSGQVNNWSQIGGENSKIVAFQRPENGLNQREMIVSVMKNLEMIDAPKDVLYDKNYGEIKDLIAGYDNSKNAIGYSYYTEAKALYDIDAKTDDTIKFLRINDIAPNYETIHNGTYPVQTNYYLVKNKNNNSERIKIFMDAILSDRGKRVVREAGYIDN